MRFSTSLCTLFPALFAVLVFAAGCGKDSASASCSFDTDCPLGQVCGVADSTCIVADCQFCTPDQICYRPTPDAPGSCSAPECSGDADCAEGSCRGGVCTTGGCVSNSDCGEGEICNLVGVCEMSDGTCSGNADCPTGQICKDDACVAGCAADNECEDDEYCTADGACATGCRDSMGCTGPGEVCTDGTCACTATSCPDGTVCLGSGSCGAATDCAQIDCGTQVCNPSTLQCQDPCTADSCQPNEICNMTTGLCAVNNCPGEDPNQCAGNAQRPNWDPIKCFCAECLSDSDCNTAAGETCNAAGQCFACQTTCNAQTPGTCGGGTPYCINDCCVECVGAADCGQGELCLDGTCGPPPNCQVDPSVCPAGYTCNQATGQCDAPSTGGACDPADPMSCPFPGFCDPTTSTCQGGGGEFGCGLCNPDCTCPTGFTCNGFYCSAPDPLACLTCPGDPLLCAATFLLGEVVCIF